jgi:hypothetical protein
MRMAMVSEEIYTKGIADIVETEGNVPRFTKICQELYQHKLYSWNEIVPLVKKVTGFTHHNPVRRHIAAFTKLGILDQRDATYILSSEGRVLLELTKGKAFEERLTLPEKIFYFRAFFSNALFQLFLVLQKIDQKHDLTDQKEMITDYFRTVLDSPLKIWQRDSLRRDIEIHESRGHLQKGLQNKFGCMKAWLRHLELLEGKGLDLSPLGREVLKDLENNGLSIGERIFSTANIYLTGKIGSLPPFDYSKNGNKDLFLELFELAYSLFETPQLGLSDAKSIRCFLCIKLLVDHQLTLEEKSFDDIVNELARSHIVRSLMTGRDRKLAYISGFSRG